MSCFEFSYLNSEEYDTFEKSSEEEKFEIAQALLNNDAEYDENYDIDWNEIE
ncbi:34580_t:CDS:2, partial [Gigaspora margarita]